MTPDPLSTLANRAFLYGFPLVFGLEQVQRFATTGIGATPAAPYNSFGHARTLAGPEDTFVSINNDTVYSIAQLDLSAGPLLLDLPDTHGRYYVMQFISAWTENFAYLGFRSTGTAAGRYLIVGPDWDSVTGSEHSDVKLVQSPTQIATLMGRWAVTGKADLAAVARLQDGTRLTPIGYADADGLPVVDDARLSAELAFWERYRVYSQAFPPVARDVEVQSSFAALGLTGSTPVGDLERDRREALIQGYRDGIASAQQLLHNSRGDAGWTSSQHIFDFSIDHFEIGTIDDPQWKIADQDERLLLRTAAALAGLWGAHAYEAVYFTAYQDGDGNLLTGDHTYELTLNPPPPNGAFWSLTMYQTPDFTLVDNRIDRYSVGDRTRGLVTDAAGAVTITVAASMPTDATAQANWLPAPDGPFRPILRVYLPDQTVLDGTYELPAFTRIR
ncbi:DUF1254 domain-containing protein [Mycobacterium sp. 236(2023)]|uniref:DUF1254 domain-containing protein n=1 Tax=Mycobacterium sp. 236(2023) TaxID=3038163 RepID=UPI002415932A|nr:DUF1254 domain-containing protein [Mycobacterium sp. 236(2023)]MDG4667259.1 DUF1254 domain-containing protein [Mycobacterium sp. 236(2023)]